MNVITTEPFLDSLIESLIDDATITHLDDPAREKLSTFLRFKAGSPTAGQLDAADREAIAFSEIPDLLVCFGDPPQGSDSITISQQLSDFFKVPIRVYYYFPRSLEEVFVNIEELGKTAGAAFKGRDLGNRLKAQLLDWADNFYSRMKNKRVTFLSGVSPLSLGGFWIPDMIGKCSATSQLFDGRKGDRKVTWQEIREFKPDVIVVSPRRASIAVSLAEFKAMEKFPDWDNIPAVKRGEVIFTDGDIHFYYPGMKLFESAGILVSAIAGLESGYITARDSFHRLRWIELNRHKF